MATVESLSNPRFSLLEPNERFALIRELRFARRTKPVVEKTKNELAESLLINVDQVWIVTESGEVSVPLSEISVGDKIVVRTGSSIPVDGEVLEGEALVNQSSMTGESTGVFKKMKDSVFAGTVVEDGNIVVQVKALSKELSFKTTRK